MNIILKLLNIILKWIYTSNWIVETKGIPTETWEKYFRELYKGEDSNDEHDYNTEDRYITKETEVEARMKILKNRRSPGTNSIRPLTFFFKTVDKKNDIYS